MSPLLRLVLAVLLVATAAAVHGQTPSDNKQVQDAFEEGKPAMEVIPEFPGGIRQFYIFVAENMKYPSSAVSMGIEGKVYVQFVVDKKGRVDPKSVMILKGIGAGCDEEAVRVVKMSPQWIPGRKKKGGKKVEARMVLPLTFRLRKSKSGQ